MFRYIFTETQYIKIRVGGYSHRAASMVYYLIKHEPMYKNRVEYVSDYMNDLSFDWDSEFIKRADEYDFKGFDGHSCVYYFVNGIDSGFTDENGNFLSFYGARHKGKDAVEEVIMAIGYNDIPAATAAIHTYSSDSLGDMLAFGGKTTKKKSRGRSRQDLFEEFNIPYLDIHKTLPSLDILREDLKKEKDRSRIVWLEKHAIQSQDGEYMIVADLGRYMFMKSNSFLTTPNSIIVNTRYSCLANKIIEDWKDKGYESHKKPTSILNYHFTCIDDFLFFNQQEAVDYVNSFDWDKHWALGDCPDTNPSVVFHWKNLLGTHAERVETIKRWLSKCSHMQLAAITCVFNACKNMNLVYLMAFAIEKMKENNNDKDYIQASISFLNTFDSQINPDELIEIYSAFKFYYGIHVQEDGVKVE